MNKISMSQWKIITAVNGQHLITGVVTDEEGRESDFCSDTVRNIDFEKNVARTENQVIRLLSKS